MVLSAEYSPFAQLSRFRLPWTLQSPQKDAPDIVYILRVCTMFLCRKFNASIASSVLVIILVLLLITSDLEHFLLNNLGNYLTEVFLK